MTTLLHFGRDDQGYNAFAPEFADENYSASIVNGSDETFTIPSNYPVWVISFSYQPGTTNWVARNTTASIPAGATFAATTSDLNPGARLVYAGDVIHVLTASATAEVSVSLYALPRNS